VGGYGCMAENVHWQCE